MYCYNEYKPLPDALDAGSLHASKLNKHRCESSCVFRKSKMSRPATLIMLEVTKKHRVLAAV